ncbi:MAG TPA: sigma-70 family RNA polymerase sigma factor [Thermoanaerobaculia bacterium]|nr:sigma-70 family RNA polymerase sigma factor [Thermoanaerobaculia bacterium]
MTPERNRADRDLASTQVLLAGARAGDESAREELVERFLPVLRRWAHGRLPTYARGLVDTDDLVQVTLIRALNNLDHFEPKHEGAFLAYLRRIVLNSVRDEIRRSMRAPQQEEVTEMLVDRGPSLLERTLGREVVESYERALGALPEAQQEAVILRVEFGYSYPEIAAALGRPSANAVRMMVSRALVSLAEGMDERGSTEPEPGAKDEP